MIKLEKSTTIILLVFIPLLAAPIIFQDGYISSVFIFSLWLGTLAAAFDISIGYSGVVNFGYAGFIGLGAYTSALLAFHFGVSPWIGLFAALIVSAAAGYFLSIITLRLSGLYLAVMTWFFAEALKFTFATAINVTKGFEGLLTVPFPTLDFGLFILDYSDITRLPSYSLLLCLTIPILLFLSFFVRSKYGLIFRAIKDDRLASEMMGVDTAKYRSLGFTITCAIAGILGGFYAHYIGVLTPSVFGIMLTIQVLTITYLGGRGTLWGPFLAAYFMTGLFEVLRPLVIVERIIYGVLLVVAMLVFPSGIFKSIVNLIKKSL